MAETTAEEVMDWRHMETQLLVIDLLCESGVIPKEVAKRAKEILVKKNRIKYA